VGVAGIVVGKPEFPALGDAVGRRNFSRAFGLSFTIVHSPVSLVLVVDWLRAVDRGSTRGGRPVSNVSHIGVAHGRHCLHEGLLESDGPSTRVAFVPRSPPPRACAGASLDRDAFRSPSRSQGLADGIPCARVGNAHRDDRHRSVSALAGRGEGLAAAHPVRAHSRVHAVFRVRPAPVARVAHEAATEFGELVRPVRERLLGHPNMFHPAQDAAIAPGVHLAEKLGDLPILGGNTIEVLTDYDAILDRLAADIDQAQRDVHLLFYIISDDPVAGRVLAALERAAKRGVACRVLADALGSRGFRYEALAVRLREAGIEAMQTMRIAFIRERGARMDLRNHRKIAVVDGRIAYTGSLNLVDPTFKPGLTYEELMVRVTGPVVLELQAVFVQDWYLETGKPIAEEAFPDPAVTGPVPRRSCHRVRSIRGTTRSGSSPPLSIPRGSER
jgi:hypothetical protein